MQKNTKGFSLVELSIILALFGFVVVIFVPKLSVNKIQDINRLKVTYERMNEIHKFIALFKQKYGRLPCPADLSIEEMTTYNYNSRIIAYDDEKTAFSPNGLECAINIGAVPTGALGLDSEYMLDGFENRFTYRVSNKLCGNSTNKCTPSSFNSNKGDLIIKDSSGGETIISNAAYVLISHGEKGAYAFSSSGIRSGRNSTNPDEQQNGNFSASGSNSNIYISKQLSAEFGQIVQYRTKEQINNMFINETEKVITINECINNSNWLAEITNSIALNIRSAYLDLGTNFIRTNEMINPSIEYNQLDKASLDILWSMQEVCGVYYNITKKCPGGGTYDIFTNSCYCANGSWGGTC